MSEGKSSSKIWIGIGIAAILGILFWLNSVNDKEVATAPESVLADSSLVRSAFIDSIVIDQTTQQGIHTDAKLAPDSTHE